MGTGGPCPSGAAPIAGLAPFRGPPLDLPPLGLAVALLDQFGQAGAKLLDFALEQFELLGGWIEGLGAGAVRKERAGALLGRDQSRAGRDADHGRAWRNVAGHHRIGADP